MPASEFFLPIRDVNAEGELEIENATYVASRFRDHDITDGIASWGLPFLTMNYMVNDYQKMRFRLAPALQGPYGFSRMPLVQPLCQGLATNGTNSSSPALPSPSAHPQHSNHAGAIAGGVVGGLAGLTIIGALIFLLLRSWRREKKARTERDAAISEQQAAARKVLVVSPDTGTEPTETSELGNDSRVVSEWFWRQSHQEPAEVSGSQTTN